MSDYLSMGGYAAFVWPAYGLSALVMAGLLIGIWRRLKTNERDLARLQALRDGLHAEAYDRRHAEACDGLHAEACDGRHAEACDRRHAEPSA